MGSIEFHIITFDFITVLEVFNFLNFLHISIRSVTVDIVTTKLGKRHRNFFQHTSFAEKSISCTQGHVIHFSIELRFQRNSMFSFQNKADSCCVSNAPSGEKVSFSIALLIATLLNTLCFH